MGRPTYRARAPRRLPQRRGAIRAGMSGSDIPPRTALPSTAPLGEVQSSGSFESAETAHACCRGRRVCGGREPGRRRRLRRAGRKRAPIRRAAGGDGANNTPLWRCTGTQISPTRSDRGALRVRRREGAWCGSTAAARPATRGPAGFVGTLDRRTLATTSYAHVPEHERTSGVVKFDRRQIVDADAHGTTHRPEHARRRLPSDEIFDIVGYGLQDVRLIEVATRSAA